MDVSDAYDARAAGGHVAAARLLARRGLERRPVVLTVAAALLAAIFGGLRFVSDPAYGAGLLAVVPIALLALELGLRGGIGATALSTGLLAVSAIDGHPELGVVGVTTRGLVFLAIGTLAGRFSDQMRAAHEREGRLLESGLAVGAATSIDQLARAVADAAPDIPGVQEARLVVGRKEPLARTGALAVPLTPRGGLLGRIEADVDGLRLEDRAALEVLGQQVALALDNLQLLERERERATVEANLHHARRQLLEQRSGLSRLLDSQEQERAGLARRVHEELAQILAAVLLGLQVLRDAGSHSTGPLALDDLYEQVRSVLAELRDVAGALHPATLSDLGLRPALEALAERRAIALEIADLPDDLSPLVRTGVYRIVEQMAAGAGRPVRISVERLDGELHLAVEGPTDDDALDAIRARAILLDGAVDQRGPDQALVRLPLAPGRTAAAGT